MIVIASRDRVVRVRTSGAAETVAAEIGDAINSLIEHACCTLPAECLDAMTEHAIAPLREMLSTHRWTCDCDECVPASAKEGIDRYVSERVNPGDFLMAVLRNDLKSALQRADDENGPRIASIVSYLYNCCPEACWGSPEKVKEWLK